MDRSPVISISGLSKAEDFIFWYTNHGNRVTRKTFSVCLSNSLFSVPEARLGPWFLVLPSLLQNNIVFELDE